MYLKQIEIHGFKSFAEKTVLQFLPPKNGKQSITAVVGPNGSGKSNVSDAIRWVMGEQKTSHLRAKKSEDVIFSGSASKGKMGMASVMMTLDNADGRADVEYEELVLGRRLYRSGESEYVVNGNVVRLLDLQLLLAKAQFGQGSYAIIGQGMIDRLLLQSSGERKKFFDEASGIKEFQIKRHQASLRLNRTRDHIEQAELLLKEVAPRLKTLSRQVKKLEERKELEIQLVESQEQYYVTLWKHHESALQALEVQLKEVDTALHEGQGKLNAMQSELAELAHQASRQDAFAALQNEYQHLQQQKHTKERERAVLQGKLQTEYKRSGNHQMSWLESKTADLKQRQKELEHEVSSLQGEKSTADKGIALLQKQLADLSVSKTALKSELSSLESRLLQLKSEQSAFQITGFRAVQAVLEARHELGGVRGVVAQLGSVEQQYHMALDVAAGGRLASVVVDDEQTARSCVDYLRQGKLGVATFLPISKVRGRNIPHYIDELLNRNGVHGLAQDLVDFDHQYEEIFSFVFGSTLVVEDFETARAIGIGRARMVTLQGDLFETSGAIKGGHRNMRQHGISFADGGHAAMGSKHAESCEQEIAEKQQELAEYEEQHQSLQGRLMAEQSRTELLANKMEMLLEQKKSVDTELAGLEQELAMQTMSPEQIGKVMEQLADQKKDIDGGITALDTQLQHMEEKIGRFHEEEEQKKQRVFALQDAMQEAQKEVNALVNQKNEYQVERAKIDTKKEDLQHEAYQELRVSIEKIAERGIETVEVSKLELLQGEIQKLKYKLSLIGGIDQEVVDEYEETKERHEGLTVQLDDLNKAVKDLEKLIDELDALMKKRRGKAFKNIKSEFARYFSILFEGGKADLVEQFGSEEEAQDAEEAEEAQEAGVDEDLDHEPKKKRRKKVLTGIDITACPPGKKIKHLQALSGGERTMTSIALMCAILKTNPSPFVVLDEVEAALDEANTLRVVNILKELSSESQFVVITHNRVTMHAADALYGVTMGNDGISHLLSVNMSKAEALADE